MRDMQEIKKPVESGAPGEKPKAPAPCYPETHREYEKLMQHDAYKKVKGRVRQTKWGERS